MKGLHILEVFFLSLLAPAILGFLFWRDIKSVKNEIPKSHLDWEELKSRTRPVVIFEGDFEGIGKIRVFQGIVPGIDSDFAIKRINKRLNLGNNSLPLTLLLWNNTKNEIHSLGSGWELIQDSKKKWKIIPEPKARDNIGKLYTSIFTAPNTLLPPGKIARHLFLSKEGIRPEKKTMVLKNSTKMLVLKPLSIPAEKVLLFKNKKEKKERQG